MSELYLMHHGIKGQKWGVRRYQNEDGTLTEAGKKRYINSYGEENHQKMAKDYQKSLNTSEYRMGKVKSNMPKYENEINNYKNKLNKLETKGLKESSKYDKISNKLNIANTKLSDLESTVNEHKAEIDSFLKTIGLTNIADVNYKDVKRDYTKQVVVTPAFIYRRGVKVQGKKYKLNAK